jgi:type VI secretion system protein ImpL
MPYHLMFFNDSSQNLLIIPEWIKVVFKFENVRLNAVIQENIQKAGALGKTVQKGKEIIGKIDKEKQKSLAALETAGKSLLDYQNALTQIMTAAKSRAAIFQMLTDAFNQDAATGEAPFFKAHNSINKMKGSLAGTVAEQKIFWQLVTGPLDFYWTYFSKETACHLQNMWEKDVLVEVQGLGNQMNLNKLILGEEGYALKFVKGPAAPFIGSNPGRGFYAKSTLGKFIAFEAGFMSFLTQGARARASAPLKESYSVTITGLPTSANPNALAQPHAVNLKLPCATETQQVINRNYPVKKTITWSPQNCGDILFEIEISNLVCTRRYTGPMAFAKFLGDFARGEHVFQAEDFPEQALALKNLNVKFIQVKYEFSGHQPILELSRSTPEKVPWTIAKCWEQ